MHSGVRRNIIRYDKKWFNKKFWSKFLLNFCPCDFDHKKMYDHIFCTYKFHHTYEYDHKHLKHIVFIHMNLIIHRYDHIFCTYKCDHTYMYDHMHLRHMHKKNKKKTIFWCINLIIYTAVIIPWSYIWSYLDHTFKKSYIDLYIVAMYD